MTANPPPPCPKTPHVSQRAAAAATAKLHALD